MIAYLGRRPIQSLLNYRNLVAPDERGQAEELIRMLSRVSS